MAETDKTETSKNATRRLARHAATLSYEMLPPSLVDLTKQCVLDTLGVLTGASTLAAEAGIIAEYVKDQGGKPEASILGFGGKAPAPWAAFVNGGFGHMLDYDDVGYAGHVSIASVPVAFVMAEKKGGVSGRDLITAIASGADVHTRLAQSIDIPDWTMTEGWFATQLFGYITGAAAAGRVAGLNEEQMDNAFGIGFNQMCGSRQMAVGTATHMRGMQAGFASHGATLAVELAQRGIIGDKEILEGRYGLFKTYVRTGTPDWEAILGGMGTKFAAEETHNFKVWPACAYTRSTNTATQRLRQEHNLRPGDVVEIAIVGGTGGTKLLCEPLELKRRPKSAVDGKYSIPFTTAVMMVKGNVTLHDYTEKGLNDPAVHAMADKVVYRDAPPDPNEKHVKGGVSASAVGKTTVEIRTKDGRVLSCRPTGVPGDPNNPVDRKMLETKFRDCVSFSAKRIPAANIDRAIDMVWDLENLSDATEIIRLLT